MARQKLIDRFRKQYELTIHRGSYPNGGFIMPDGALIPAYCDHEAKVQVVGGTLKNLIKGGVVRYHYATETMGIDFPHKEKIQCRQLNALLRIIRNHRPVIVIISQVGRRQAVVLGATGKRWRNAHIVLIAKGGNVV